MIQKLFMAPMHFKGASMVGFSKSSNWDDEFANPIATLFRDNPSRSKEGI